jgi:hypothetical protein
MRLGLDGVSPGEDTQYVLVAHLLILRTMGAMALLALFIASRWVDAYLVHVAGVPLSVIEILIVVSTVTQCYRSVRITCHLMHVLRPTPRAAVVAESSRMQVARSLKETRTMRTMRQKLAGIIP